MELPERPLSIVAFTVGRGEDYFNSSCKSHVICNHEADGSK